MRAYSGDEDYWKIREFLREVFLCNNRRRIAWLTSNFDYWRWHMVENVGLVDSLEEAIFIWENEEHKIAAVLINQDHHQAILNIHPNFRTKELEAEMLAIAEQHFATRGKNFYICACENDRLRQELLTQRGYTVTQEKPEYQWWYDLTQTLPKLSIPDGYTVRAIGDIEELPSRSWTSWRAFHPDEPDENYQGWEWSLNWQRAPLYRRDLDIVAVTPDAQLVAYCVFWFDDVIRTGLFEPVAVMPEHQRRGLGTAIMIEAMQRAKRMGATLATVSGYETGANALYRSLATSYDLHKAWVKML